MTDKILEVRGLTKTYGGEKKPGAKQPTPTLDVLKGIDIDIYRGDVVCLIGPSGCGKSTFLKTLNRMNDLVPNVRIEGDVRLRANIRPVVDHTGDGADGAAADPCDILDGQICHVGEPRFLKVFRERCRERFQ